MMASLNFLIKKIQSLLSLMLFSVNSGNIFWKLERIKELFKNYYLQGPSNLMRGSNDLETALDFLFLPS